MATAVVTGAGQGLGRAVAERLAADGFDVIALDRDGAAADRTATAVGGRGAEVDVTDGAAVSAFAQTLDALDVLVNNAGIWRLQRLDAMDEADQEEVLDINIMGTVRCTRALAPLLAASPAPAIVNLSSGAAAVHAPGLGVYPASKAGVESLTRQWAMELAPVRVNAIGPGLIVTEGTRANYEGEAGTARARAVPVGRVGEPEDIANVVSFLVGPQAAYVSGQIIYVDGGLSAGSPGR